MSTDRLIDAILQKKNPTVLGLDPQPSHLPPEFLQEAAEEYGETLEALAIAAVRVNEVLIDALHDIVPAVKLQLACYEQLGPAGMVVFAETAELAKAHGLYVIADGKRGDIGSTSEAYSAAYLGGVQFGDKFLTVYDTDALTVNPYLGSDNLEPFIKDCERHDKMLFVLCKTSNPSSREVQELPAGDRVLYKVIAEQISRAGAKLVGSYGYSAIGIVAGATQPSAMRVLRERHPGLFFLVPGYGAQGGNAEDIAYSFDKYGRGAIVNNSRGITCAWQKSGDPLPDAARRAAIDMRNDLQKHIIMV
ncbi:MAG: orotidine-5'-phosphate decarboxylase [Oscillospiraceae bacterium]|nr:orotidine-5'-phosphate decarboxylase [Oscillospiraceae bacterium]